MHGTIDDEAVRDERLKVTRSSVSR